MRRERLAEANRDLRGSLLLACVVNEEVTGYGTKDILEKGYAADFGIVGEPTELSVQTAHKGAIHFNITTLGKTAHSSLPQLGLNPYAKWPEFACPSRIRRKSSRKLVILLLEAQP
jgi:succinyl-diaminopimelate desuccinylase